MDLNNIILLISKVYGLEIIQQAGFINMYSSE